MSLTPQASPRWLKLLRLLWIPAGLGLLAAIIVGVTLMFVAETYTTDCLALLLITLGCVAPAVLLCFEPLRKRYLPKLVWSLLSIALLLIVIVIYSAPTGTPESNSNVGQTFLHGGEFPRYSPFNLVPEIDQYKLGFMISGRVGLLQSPAEAQRVGEVFMPLYRAMEQRKDYRTLGSVSQYTLAELWGGTFDVGHTYHYVPAGVKAPPAVIFMHGFGGNNKAYMYLWEGFGAKNHCIVLCPSFGFGFYRGGEVEAVERVRNYAIKTLHADPGRIFLSGYSNGGMAVTRTISAHPDHYAGALGISPVLDLDKVLSGSFRHAWNTKPLRFITGDADYRIPEPYVAQATQQLKAAGLTVNETVVPGGDHFLLFDHSNDVFAQLEELLNPKP